MINSLTVGGLVTRPQILRNDNVLFSYVQVGEQEIECWGNPAFIPSVQQGQRVLVCGELNYIHVPKLQMRATHLQPCEADINVWILAGTVLKDPELRYFQSGKCKATSFLELERPGAVSDWLPLEMWGKVAEIFSNFARKGSLVAIKGSLKFNSWQDKAGVNRVDLCCLVSELELLGK